MIRQPDTRRPKLPSAVALLLAFAGVTACATVARTPVHPNASGLDSQAPPLVTRVEHFYAHSDDAERLFYFFRDKLQLPEVSPFRSYGEFASGTVSLGNVAFELVREDSGSVSTEFAGIALEPSVTTSALLPELTRRGILHHPPDSDTFPDRNGQLTGWIVTALPALSHWGVFFCDFIQRQEVAGRRLSASAELGRRGGGPLGITRLRELVLDVTAMEPALGAWRRLMESPAQEADGRIAFAEGPHIRLVPGESARIREIVIEVESLERARAFLRTSGLLGESTPGRVEIAPDSAGGLAVALVSSHRDQGS